MAWMRGKIEKPDLLDPRDREKWEHMETIMNTAKKVVERAKRVEERLKEEQGKGLLGRLKK